MNKDWFKFDIKIQEGILVKEKEEFFNQIFGNFNYDEEQFSEFNEELLDRIAEEIGNVQKMIFKH